MATNSENVLVALTGAVGVGPLGTTLPTDTTTTWDSAIDDLGGRFTMTYTTLATAAVREDR